MRRFTSVLDVVSLIKALDYGFVNIFTVYTNSLLATLNARKSISNTVDDTSHFLVSAPTTRFASNNRDSPKRHPSLSILVETTKTQNVYDRASWNDTMVPSTLDLTR
jgi:hypothetical protein